MCGGPDASNKHDFTISSATGGNCGGVDASCMNQNYLETTMKNGKPKYTADNGAYVQYELSSAGNECG